jgi:hypothetical protein
LIYNWRHEIGSFAIDSSSSSPIKALETGNMTYYTSDCDHGGIIHLYFQSVTSEEPISIQLPDALDQRIRHFTSPPYLGREIQVFPSCYLGQIDPSLHPFRPLDPDSGRLPIMCAPQVRHQLGIAAKHPDDVFFVLHAFSVGIIDLALQQGHIFYADPLSFVWWDRPQYYLVEDALRRLFCAFMPAQGGFPLHSSAVVRHNRAALLVAPDGGGKSTAAELCPDGLVLCDDRNILRQHDSEILVHSTPWGRICSGPSSAQLGAVFLLEKADFFELSLLSKRELMAFLWQDNSFLWMQQPVSHRVRAYDDLAAMIHAVPTFRLKFPHDYIDWKAVDSAMGVK